jgi:hypothetical protein
MRVTNAGFQDANLEQGLINLEARVFLASKPAALRAGAQWRRGKHIRG